ncbi:MAG TPA: hypothetical protein VEL28_18905 [Candidatus Binatia bacterium]|nr:hypothetical protein [Candidatus Binatia bacterium]
MPFRSVASAFALLVTLQAGPALAGSGDCGQPVTNFNKPTASDALGVLRAAVGTLECDDCVCDVDTSGDVNASDALRTLRFAVGTVDALDCLECPVVKSIGVAGGVLESNDHRVVLNVPPFALTETTELSIEEIPVSDLPGSISGIAERAYRLGPDGLDFDAPAELDVIVDGDPRAAEGELSAELALLVSVDGNATELLPVQQLFVDGDQGVITAGAAMSHFSELAVLRVDVEASVAGIPEEAEVEEAHSLDVAVVEDAGESLVEVDSAAYTDNNFGAWAPSEGAIVSSPLDETAPGTFEDSFGYECTTEAAVAYRPQLHTLFDVTGAIDGSPENVPHLTVFEQTVLCEP